MGPLKRLVAQAAYRLRILPTEWRAAKRRRRRLKQTDTERVQELLNKYADAVAYVAVADDFGNHNIGSAFHVGEGVFVTARHVVEHRHIQEVGFGRASLNIVVGPVFHPNKDIDLAVFRAEAVDPSAPLVPLGGHLDDWIRDEDWRGSKAIVIGFPPIPMTTAPILVATTAEVNAVIEPRPHKKVCFVMSAMARGGFSGGVAFHEWGFVLGVVVESLVANDAPAELGFLSVLSVESIYECLAFAKLLPDIQQEEWDDFWYTTTSHFTDNRGFVLGGISEYDNGKKIYIELYARERSLKDAVTAAALAELSGEEVTKSSQSSGLAVRIAFHDVNARVTMNRIKSAATKIFESSGLTHFHVATPHSAPTS